MIQNGKSRYSYQATLATAQRVNWRIEDIIGGDKQLDFSRPLCPSRWRGWSRCDFLTRDEKRTLNQIRGNATCASSAWSRSSSCRSCSTTRGRSSQGDDYRVRALLQFAGEEAKHIQLFKRFRRGVRARLRHRLRGDRPAGRRSPRPCSRTSRSAWRW